MRLLVRPIFLFFTAIYCIGFGHSFIFSTFPFPCSILQSIMATTEPGVLLDNHILDLCQFECIKKTTSSLFLKVLSFFYNNAVT
uniref:Putative secreted protein n=1 Tax=Ixodes ricinus TaxID=34613 RepID=A0A6B0U9N4_IXORI